MLIRAAMVGLAAFAAAAGTACRDSPSAPTESAAVRPTPPSPSEPTTVSDPASTDVVGEGWQLGLSDVLLLSDVIVVGRVVSADDEVEVDGSPVDLVSVAVDEVLLGAPDAHDSSVMPSAESVISVSAMHDQPLDGFSIEHPDDEAVIIGLQPEPDQRLPTTWRINFTAVSQPDGTVTFDGDTGQRYTDWLAFVADGARTTPTVETLIRLASELHVALDTNGAVGPLAELLSTVESGGA